MIMPCLERPEEEGGLLDEIDRPIDRDVVKAMVPVLRERIKVLPDVVDLIDFLFVDEVHPNPEEMIGRRMDEEMVFTSLNASIEALEILEPFDGENIETALRGLTETTGLKAGQLFTPIRVAVTAKRIAPPLFESIEVLGKERTIERLRNGLEIFTQHVENRND